MCGELGKRFHECNGKRTPARCRINVRDNVLNSGADRLFNSVFEEAPAGVEHRLVILLKEHTPFG